MDEQKRTPSFRMREYDLIIVQDFFLNPSFTEGLLATWISLMHSWACFRLGAIFAPGRISFALLYHSRSAWDSAAFQPY